MKPGKNKKIKAGRATHWLAPLLISCAIILGSSFVLGPILSDTAISQKIVVAYHCPDATDTTEERGPIVQAGSDPNAFGQTVRIICTFADGSTKVISNDENALTTIIGSLGLGAMIGVGIVIIFIPLYIFWKKKAPKVSQKKH